MGEGTGTDPSGVYATSDGGKTWRPLSGKVSPGWLAADFLNPDAGILVGTLGTWALAMEGKIVASPRFERLGIRGLYDVILNEERGGWLVGDGGLVLQTKNSGLFWQTPETPLADGIQNAFDFRTVCCRGEKVWVAGQPGSAVWHSANAGQSWEKQVTGQAVPLARLHFSSDNRGWGVGALGTVLKTDDGGKTWKAVRGGGRRLALMALFGNTSQVSLGLIADLSGEAGYRSLISVIARDDEAAGVTEAELSARLDDAMTTAGGSASQIGWQLPLIIPGLERDSDRLIADWNRRTENRLEENLTGALVRQIRTWRPSVLVIQQPETGNALAKLIGEMALRAVGQAADSTRFLEHQELAGLEPWQVQKVFVRLPQGSSGHVNIDPFRYLAQIGESANMIVAKAEGLFREQADLKPVREAYRLARSQWVEGEEPTFAGGFFGGISIPSGTAARRAAQNIDDSNLEARQKNARRQRDFAAICEQMLVDDRRAGKMVAELSRAVRGMSDAQAAWQMTHLAEQYQAIGQWQLAEMTLIELVEKYPDQPAALRAMQCLVQLWASGEVTWRRLRESSTLQRLEQNQGAAITQAGLQQAAERLRKQERKRNRTIFDPDEETQSEKPAVVAAGAPAQGRDMAGEGRIFRKDLDQKYHAWQLRALKMAKDLERRDAALAAEPAVQFPLAAIHRQRTAFLKSDDIYRRYAAQAAGTPWALAAEGELWLTNPATIPTGSTAACGYTMARPVIDGILSDRCWLAGTEMPLFSSTRKRNEEGPHVEAKLCYDDQYLYFAASVPRAKGMRTDGPTAGGERRYDEDLSDFDRIVLSLDVDRDYVTSFNFAIDQRGCTAESCWHDASWNPRWFVAVGGDKTHWRVEAAIPLDELTFVALQRGSAWGVGITRIIPAIGIESWTQPSTSTIRPETFGVLRFDAPGDPR